MPCSGSCGSACRSQRISESTKSAARRACILATQALSRQHARDTVSIGRPRRPTSARAKRSVTGSSCDGAHITTRSRLRSASKTHSRSDGASATTAASETAAAEPAAFADPTRST
eukprot:2716650-Pleurochrysis_carterae.AAC.2